jgi:hypothetical protein
VHRDTAEPVEDAGGVDALVPRLGWQVIRVYLSVRAQCTQCGVPATRSPVSSNPATSASARRSVSWLRKPSRRSAARVVMLATVPSDTGVPNSSASAWAVRFLDRNCPT